jgi:Transposase DDE domain group 1
MSDDTILPFSFPAVSRKKVTAVFDGGRMTSDGGVMLLAAAERRMEIAHRLAGLIADPRNPLLVTHSVADILRARMLAIACGYEDADDLDHLRTDPGFKLACSRLPDTGDDLCSQPTVSRWENAPSLREVMRMTYPTLRSWGQVLVICGVRDESNQAVAVGSGLIRPCSADLGYFLLLGLWF